MRPEFKRLVDEIGKVLVYVASQSRGDSVDIIYLLGGIARWPGIEKLLGEMLALPLEVMNPLLRFNAENIDQLDPEQAVGAGFAVATGCALKGVIESDE
jgi:Tfp pilus assembly PilM family ATPase